MKNTKKRGLSRQFTRDIKSSDNLEPSDFTVTPKVIPKIETEDPLEKIRQHRKENEEIEKPEKEFKPIEVKMPDKEKISLIAGKLNFLKRTKKSEKQEIKKEEPREKKLAEKPQKVPEKENRFFKKLFSKDKKTGEQDKKEELKS